MAKLTRKQFKQFAGSAVLADVDKFGSVAAGGAITSLDPDVIQALGAWATGWKTAVMGNKSPIVEDMNAVDFIFAYMLFCILEEGVPDWETNTTYWIGSIVNSGGTLYRSLANSNQGNAVTNTVYWTLAGGQSLNPQITATLAARAVATWTGKTAALNSINLNKMCWAPELALFVTVGNTDTNGVAVSSDGATWTGHDASGNKSWQDVAWSPELRLLCAIATGSGTALIMTSPDGTTWTNRVSAISGFAGASICWAPELGLFVATGLGGQVQTSPDGVTWTSRTAAAALDWRSVTWSPALAKLVAVAASGTTANNVMTSVDGVTWVTPTLVGSEANQWQQVCWANDKGLLVAVANNGTHRVMWSRDAVTWNTATAAEANSWTGIAYAPEIGLFAAVANDGTNRVMTSPDAVTWTARAAASAKTWYGIGWSPKLGIFASGSADGGGSSTGMMISKYVQKFIAP